MSGTAAATEERTKDVGCAVSLFDAAANAISELPDLPPRLPVGTRVASFDIGSVTGAVAIGNVGEDGKIQVDRLEAMQVRKSGETHTDVGHQVLINSACAWIFYARLSPQEIVGWIQKAGIPRAPYYWGCLHGVRTIAVENQAPWEIVLATKQELVMGGDDDGEGEGNKEEEEDEEEEEAVVMGDSETVSFFDKRDVDRSALFKRCSYMDEIVTIQRVLQTTFWGRCYICSPSSIKRRYPKVFPRIARKPHTSTADHYRAQREANKASATRHVRSTMSRQLDGFSAKYPRMKPDDIADAVIIGEFGAEMALGSKHKPAAKRRFAMTPISSAVAHGRLTTVTRFARVLPPSNPLRTDLSAAGAFQKPPPTAEIKKP